METKFQLGLHGQQIAEKFLFEKGYKILARNYRIKTGEIDLVAFKDTYVVFTEVKFRRNFTYGEPLESVNYAKKKQIIKTAMHYITKNALHQADIRFDVIEVTNIGGKYDINHIENAFDAW